MRHSIQLIDNKFQNLKYYLSQVTPPQCLYVIPWLVVRNWNCSLKPISWTYKDLNHERREWTLKWINNATSGAKCWLRCNNGNRYNTSLATLDNTWYLLQLSLHHPNISKFASFLPSQFSAKNFISSLLQPTNCSTCKKCSYREWTITYGSLASLSNSVLSLLLCSCTFGEWIEE